MNKLRPRFNKHEKINESVRRDWISVIKQDPNSYDALLYLPEDEMPQEDSLYETLEVLSLDENQKTLEYQDPIIVSVVDAMEPQSSFVTNEQGDSNHVDQDGIMRMKIAHDSVPIGSVIEWVEEQSSGDTKRVWWYVQSIQGFGTTNVGNVYYLIPCRDFSNINYQQQ